MKFAVEIVEPHVADVYPNPTTWGAMLEHVEKCGRISHKSEGAIKAGSAEKFVGKVAVKLGHESILEHIQLSARFVCSRACSHQIVRHRIGAYTQESTRYCDYTKGNTPILGVVVPPNILEVYYGRYGGTIDVESDGGIEYRIKSLNGTIAGVMETDDVLALYLKSCIQAYVHYHALVNNGVKPEDARRVLPLATKTEIWVTYNLRSWLHFFKMRCDRHAEWEIRRLADAMKDLFKQHLPAIL